MTTRALSLQQFIIQQERQHPEATGEFTNLLTDIALAAKIINREVTRAGLVDILGLTGTENVHGEKVTKLDRFAHETIYAVLGSTGQLAVRGAQGMFTRFYYTPVEMIGLYWHFVDLVWIFLFPLLYLLGRH